MKRKVRKKTKLRLFVALIFFGTIISTLGYTFFGYIRNIQIINKEKKELLNKIAELEELEEALKTDILKLEDPAYVARYAREKYLYSKSGELIIRIPD